MIKNFAEWVSFPYKVMETGFREKSSMGTSITFSTSVAFLFSSASQSSHTVIDNV